MSTVEADTLVGLIERRAAATPDAEMLVDENGRRLTFAGYRDAVERAAAGLLADGIGPVTRVSWQLPTTLEAVVLTGALAEVAVVGLPDERRGERVAAVVVPADPEPPPSLADLVAACERAGLDRFKYPEHLVLRPDLPRSPMGKLVEPAILADIRGGPADDRGARCDSTG